MRTASRVILLLLVALPIRSLAQERARPTIDQELWMSAAVEGRASFLGGLLGKDVAKRFRTSGELGYRSADSFFAGRQTYLDAGIGYKVNDHVSVGGEARYAYRSGLEDRQRACIMFQYRTEVDRLEIGYRFDYQHNFRSYGEQREILRNRVSAGYNFPEWKLDPRFSVEFFTWLGYLGPTYFGTRYKLSTEWSFRKGQTLGFGVLHDRERMVYAPIHRFIAAVDYSINLRKN